MTAWVLLAIAPTGFPSQIGDARIAVEVVESLARMTLPPGWWWALVPVLA